MGKRRVPPTLPAALQDAGAHVRAVRNRLRVLVGFTLRFFGGTPKKTRETRGATISFHATAFPGVNKRLRIDKQCVAESGTSALAY